MAFNLVFIDDNMNEGLEHPFVRAIGKFNEDANVSVFVDPVQGLNYVMENLNSRMIVFVDCKFDGYGLQGINILKKIRETTSLLYIVMMSANPLSQIAGVDVAEMINQDFIWFFDRNNGTVKDACALIGEIKNLWDVRLDCVLENWLIKHAEKKDEVILVKGNTSYTWNDVLQAVRRHTDIGKYFEKVMNQYFIARFKTHEV